MDVSLIDLQKIKKYLTAIKERGWKNASLQDLTMAVIKNQDLDQFLDADFLKKYNEGKFK
jgi:hypothetical protein